MNKVIIGITGEQGAGKEEFWKTLCKISRENNIYAYARFSTSLALRKTLGDYDVPDSRDNLIQLVKVLDESFGEGTAFKGLMNLIKDDRTTIKLIDSVRKLADEEILRSRQNSLLLYITADTKTRFNRVRNRGEKAGESNLTWEKFLEQHQMPTEVHIPEIGSRANWKIENNGTIEELEQEVRQFFGMFVKPLLEKPE